MRMAYRQVPPGRRSIVTSVSSPRPAVHQRRTSSGVVQARNTRSGGAASSRLPRMSPGPGSVTRVSAGLIVILALQVGQDGIQRVQPAGPGALVAGDPVVHGFERGPVQPVQPLPPGLAGADGADRAQ